MNMIYIYIGVLVGDLSNQHQGNDWNNILILGDISRIRYGSVQNWGILKHHNSSGRNEDHFFQAY